MAQLYQLVKLEKHIGWEQEEVNRSYHERARQLFSDYDVVHVIPRSKRYERIGELTIVSTLDIENDFMGRDEGTSLYEKLEYFMKKYDCKIALFHRDHLMPFIRRDINLEFNDFKSLIKEI